MIKSFDPALISNPPSRVAIAEGSRAQLDFEVLVNIKFFS